LQSAGYTEKVNLFAFNYPNEDAVIYSAFKFDSYIDNLISYVRNEGTDEMKACFYASKNDYINNNYKINIVGHSMGGLVARYFIENLYQDNHVDKLITICTPHWGSGYANLSNLTGDLFGIKLHALCDHDLDFDSAMYGGSNSTTINCDKGDCPGSNYTITPELQYQRQRSTKYYAIAGIDYPGGPIIQNDYWFEMSTNYTTYQQIDNFMVGKQVYRYAPSDFNPKSVGDNTVGFMSQIGWTDNIGNTPNKKIPMEKIFIDVDTNGGNGGGVFIWEAVNGLGSEIFHNKAPHRTPVCNKVIEYLED
jgi:triacylglycerol esterase/lipase EstA (alpha/beta hydrolase family)